MKNRSLKKSVFKNTNIKLTTIYYINCYITKGGLFLLAFNDAVKFSWYFVAVYLYTKDTLKK